MASATALLEQDGNHDESLSSLPPSAIHGRGMWNNFLRSFSDPLYALLDLFDNAVDATLPQQQQEEKEATAATINSNETMKKPKITVDLDTIGQNGIVIRNAAATSTPAATSSTPATATATSTPASTSTSNSIPSMAQILEIFRSTKETNNQAIGENGVGIKHACANLSDLSFVLTKTDTNTYAIGILMKDLQREVPCFPHFTLSSVSNKSALYGGLKSKCQNAKQTWAKAIAMYGDGDLEQGIDRIMLHFDEMINGADWEHCSDVFTIILAKLRQTGHSTIQDEMPVDGLYEITENDNVVEEKSQRLLKEFANKLPKLYIHINNINVQVCGKSIDMIYWETHLAERTMFEVAIPQGPEADASLKLTHGDPPYMHPTVRFFVGFDVTRPSSSAQVYFYSRQSGRLIKDMPDCRSFLNLSAGSTGFKQGLTIIVDDYNSTLPINPTKQDLSFAFQEHGTTHKTNLVFWLSGIANFFWTFHFEKHGSSKLQLTESINKAGRLMKKCCRGGMAVLPLNNRSQCFCFPNLPWTQRKVKIMDAEGGERFLFKLCVPKHERQKDSRVPGENMLAALPAVRKKLTSRQTKKRAVAKLQNSYQHEDNHDSEENALYRPMKRAAKTVARMAQPMLADSMDADMTAKNKEIQQLKKDKAKLERQVEKLKTHIKQPKSQLQTKGNSIHVRVINHETDRSADIRVTVAATKTIRDIFRSDKILRQNIFMWPKETQKRLQKKLAVIKVGVWDPSKQKGDYKYVYDEEDLGTETTQQLYENSYEKYKNKTSPICICMFVEDFEIRGGSEKEFRLQDNEMEI